jgi:hypothetical protein
MVTTNVERFTDHLCDRLGDDLRSVGWYTDDEYEVVYARDDVIDQYSDEDVAEVFRDLGIESLEKGMLEEMYEHGRLNCTIRCFEGAIEMHFVANRGEGLAVALEPAAFVAHETFIGECMRLAGIDPATGERK